MKQLIVLGAALLGFIAVPLRADDVKPIKALMLVGGCCHDYKTMPGVLTKAIEQSANVHFGMFMTLLTVRTSTIGMTR